MTTTAPRRPPLDLAGWIGPARWRAVWTRRPSHLTRWQDTRPQRRERVTVAAPTEASEEQLHYYSMAVRQAEQIPPRVPQFAPGSWAIEADGTLYQLRRFGLDQLIWQEAQPNASDHDLAYRGMLATIEKYADWIRAGSLPPPLTVQQSNKGNFMVVNGHHRGAALYRTGASQVWAWVSDTLALGVFIRGLSWHLAVELAIASALPVPESVVSYARHHFQAEAFVLANLASDELVARTETLTLASQSAVAAYLKEWGWAFKPTSKREGANDAN